MARPIKEGLEYCSLDTNIFSDRKIRRLLKTFGSKGYTIYSCLLCEIFKDKGYYMQYDDGLAFDISDNIPGVTEQLVKDVIEFCFECGLLSKPIFQMNGVLTSAGIQKRYRKAKEGSRIVIVPEIWVIDQETPSFPAETPVNPPETTQSKVKKSKVNNNKEEGSYGQIILKPVNDLKNDCLNDQAFLEYVCMQFHRSMDELPDLLNDYTRYLESLGTKVRSVLEYRNHFQNRLRKKIGASVPLQGNSQPTLKKADASKYK